MEIVAVDGKDKYNIVFIANPKQYSSTFPTAQEMIDSMQITPQDEQMASGQGTDTGEDGDKIDAGSETIVDTFDDTPITDDTLDDAPTDDQEAEDSSDQND